MDLGCVQSGEEMLRNCATPVTDPGTGADGARLLLDRVAGAELGAATTDQDVRLLDCAPACAL